MKKYEVMKKQTPILTSMLQHRCDAVACKLKDQDLSNRMTDDSSNLDLLGAKSSDCFTTLILQHSLEQWSTGLGRGWAQLA